VWVSYRSPSAWIWIAVVVPPALLLIMLGLERLETSLLGKSLRHRVRLGWERMHTLRRVARTARVDQRRGEGSRRRHVVVGQRRMQRLGHVRRRPAALLRRRRPTDRTDHPPR